MPRSKRPTASERAYARGFLSALEWAAAKKNISEVKEMHKHLKNKLKKVI